MSIKNMFAKNTSCHVDRAKLNATLKMNEKVKKDFLKRFSAISS